VEDAYVAANYCLFGCVEVVFARCHATGRVFAVCTGCGCAWFDPQPRSPEPGDLGDCVVDYREYAPQGFALASRAEIRHAGFESRIVGTRDGARWAAEFAWFNARWY